MTACGKSTTTSTTSSITESETVTTTESTEDTDSDNQDQNTPPEKADGDNAPEDSNGSPPDKPDGDNAGQPGGGFGGSGEVTQGDSANTIDSGSTWNLTGNYTISSLTNNGTINFNGYTITLADGTVLK